MKNPRGPNQLSREKALKILAWAFTIGAIAAMIYTAAFHKGGGFMAVLLTFALFLQHSSGKELKKKK